MSDLVTYKCPECGRTTKQPKGLVVGCTGVLKTMHTVGGHKLVAMKPVR